MSAKHTFEGNSQDDEDVVRVRVLGIQLRLGVNCFEMLELFRIRMKRKSGVAYHENST